MTSLEHANPSSLHGNFYGIAVFALALAAVGCGSDDDDGGQICANPDTPVVLEVTNVVPELDSSVTGPVTHSFTVVNATGTFKSLAFAFGETHTAGTPDPQTMMFTPTASEANMVYDFQPVEWEKAGHVELVETGEYSDSNGCFILPQPLFSYDVTP